MIVCWPLLPRGVAALTLTPWLILMRRESVGDTPLLDHEQTHQAQMRRDGTITFWWRYLTERQARYQLRD